MAIRGDDDINALLNEFNAASSSTTHTPPSPHPPLLDSSKTKHINVTQDVFLQSFTLSPPSNPTTEIIRHRIHEKFKSQVYDVFRSCAPNNEELQSCSSITAKKNHYHRSVIATIWKDMPAHNVWERFQFSFKGLEADCVRDMQMQGSSCSPPWKDVNLDQLLNPSVHQIYAWTSYGRSRGIVWEPLIPVSNICEDEDECCQVNQRYVRTAKELLEKEIQFQFRRSFKRCLGDNKKAPGKSKHAFCLDEMYSKLKSFAQDDETDLSGATEVKKVKRKDKKRHEKSKADNTSKADKEEFILQHLFESHTFKKAIQKLHKKLQFLYDDSYSNYMKQLKKACDQSSLQQQDGKRRKGKHNIPKISYESSDSAVEYERQATVSFCGIGLRINEGHLDKLRTLFDTTLSRLGCGVEKQQRFSQSLFTLLLRYDALEGAGLQSAIPSDVFRWMSSRFGCCWECFASPFNCWLENNQKLDNPLGGHFGSAFGDTDAVFHSAGSFFDMDFLALARRNGGRCFQANPPFASNFIESMCNRMHHFLSPDCGSVDDAKERDTAQVPIMFIVFIPAWRESHGWKALESSPYLTKHVLIPQKEDHFYLEGTQHRRRKNDGKDEKHASHRIASFDSSVFFLQNAAAAAKWKLTNEDDQKLKLAFAMKLPEVNDSNDDKGTAMQQKQSKVVKESNTDTAAPSHGRSKKKKSKGAETVRKKKPKLLDGANDEMSILASLGLVESSSTKPADPDESGGKRHKKKAKLRHTK
ncbi:hypothetical protein ACHAWO_012269 [Cyclotella atomus]|uniref:PCIF1 WW domain-containing protein n=1 Tax=Cyclotella atomus TaxID=382360 RepID=A0ABD3QVZ0_9STRA